MASIFPVGCTHFLPEILMIFFSHITLLHVSKPSVPIALIPSNFSHSLWLEVFDLKPSIGMPYACAGKVHFRKILWSWTLNPSPWKCHQCHVDLVMGNCDVSCIPDTRFQIMVSLWPWLHLCPQLHWSCKFGEIFPSYHVNNFNRPISIMISDAPCTQGRMDGRPDNRMSLTPF